MADERERFTGERQPIPAGYWWENLASPTMEGADLRILFRLQEATGPASADAPGFRLHSSREIGTACGACVYRTIGASCFVSRTMRSLT